MTNSLSIEEINVLQAENARLKMELATRNQMLMEAHFQHKKLSEALTNTQIQYNEVVKQNRELQTLAKQQSDSYEYCIQELEKKFEKVLNYCNSYSGTQPDVICVLKYINTILTTSNDVQK